MPELGSNKMADTLPIDAGLPANDVRKLVSK